MVNITFAGLMLGFSTLFYVLKLAAIVGLSCDKVGQLVAVFFSFMFSETQCLLW